jgi:predicted NAD/FAD-binding protein
MKDRMSIAVIGGGVSGVTAAYLLQNKHDITLYEKNDYVGGHTHTVTIPSGPDAGLRIDTGFIVMNDKTYPLFTRFLDALHVKTEKTDMSFSYHCRKTGLQYGSSSLNSVFAQRANLFNPTFWFFLKDILRFFKEARTGLQSGDLNGLSLDTFLTSKRFSDMFRDCYLLPMSAAIWSASYKDMGEFPMASFARFYENHGLLSVNDHPQWYYVSGGSRSYIDAFLAQFPGTVETASPVQSLCRKEDKVVLRLADGNTRAFDAAIIATHADEALALLEDPSALEKELLSPWRYSENAVFLHTDTSFLPTNTRARASWNAVRENIQTETSPITVTYDMTRLQKLDTASTYCVTLNPCTPVPEKHVLAAMVYTHPIFDAGGTATQGRLSQLNGQRNTWFCGGYFGYGFHEDGVRSGVNVGKHFGVSL